MKYKDLSGYYHRYRKTTAFKNKWYIEALKLKDLYLETGLWRWRTDDFVKLCRIIDMFEWKAISNRDLDFVKRQYETYGPDTSFWYEYTHTKRERVKYRKRVMQILYYAENCETKMDSTNKVSKRYLNKIVPIDTRVRSWVDKLLVFPLTFKEKQLVWSLERALGIWYDDLPDEEQGIFVGRKRNG